MYSRNKPSQALPSSKKTHSEKHKQILKQLLKENANKTCVDCKTSAHPRWASWNLGCFICIRCSGIHRSMGVHISKVKSVDLDAWTDEQVELMVKWGNAKCNSYWEAKLPEGYVPDQLKIENFIRTKYDMKKWVASPTVPDPMTLQLTLEVRPEASKSTPALSDGNLLDDFGSFTSASNSTPTASRTSASVPASVAASTATLSESHKPVPPPKQSLPRDSKKQSSPIVASPQSTGGSMGRPDLKKSILSLYSSPSSLSSSFVQPKPSNPAPSVTPTNLANSLQGLNFGNGGSNSTTTLNNLTFQSKPPGQSSTSSSIQSGQSVNQPNQTWANEWSDVGSNVGSTNIGSTGIKTDTLDDDLFKNVWK